MSMSPPTDARRGWVHVGDATFKSMSKAASPAAIMQREPKAKRSSKGNYHELKLQLKSWRWRAENGDGDGTGEQKL
ncbi:Hypothetical predicted protein [Drosophila guanche]|uniref:Uncharacterized protein n=1 Tax=Drosophila guanche TaxID=7266 RepID=A0A3B0JTY7_DROGU|nr:Hypothetical predicted protein [Drosophila guanche]